MAWRWTAWRIVISAYIVFHLVGIVVWNVPDSPLKQTLFPAFKQYMLRLGLWQAWWMFAPDPMGETAVLESEVIDAQGMAHLYAFPKVAELPWWRKLPRFRHPKLTCNLLLEEYAPLREFTARYAVRQLNLTPDQFPVHVGLYCKLKEPPPPGRPYVDPFQPARKNTLGVYDFASNHEVHP